MVVVDDDDDVDGDDDVDDDILSRATIDQKLLRPK